MHMEEHKRVVYFCFLLDTQSAVFFSQKPCMSVSELGLDLPCSPAAWEADTADEWCKHAATDVLPSFRLVIKDYFCRNICLPRKHLNALSHVLVLYGLIAVAWDMRYSQKTFLSIDGFPRPDDWRNQTATMFEMWKADFDAYRMDIHVSLRYLGPIHDPAVTLQFRSFVSGAVILYHTANVFLNAGIRALNISETSSQWSAQERHQINQYSLELRPAVSHAAHSIREAILETGSNEHSCLLSSPWCLYVAAAVCCAFSRLDQINDDEPSPEGQHPGHRSTFCYEDGSWNTNHRISVAISQLTESGRENFVGTAARYQAKVLSLGAQAYLRRSRCRKLADAVNLLAQSPS